MAKDHANLSSALSAYDSHTQHFQQPPSGRGQVGERPLLYWRPYIIASVALASIARIIKFIPFLKYEWYRGLCPCKI